MYRNARRNDPRGALGTPHEIVVVGAGNAALCAAIAASEQGAKVLVLERASFDESGGNTRFSGGAMRFTYRGLEDLKKVIPVRWFARRARNGAGARHRPRPDSGALRCRRARRWALLFQLSWWFGAHVGRGVRPCSGYRCCPGCPRPYRGQLSLRLSLQVLWTVRLLSAAVARGKAMRGTLMRG